MNSNIPTIQVFVPALSKGFKRRVGCGYITIKGFELVQAYNLNLLFAL